MSERKETRIAELDVLRGLAAVSVVIYHYTMFFPSMFIPGSSGVETNIRYGLFAVHLFFMISGFVIFMTISHTRSALDFIVSRFSRLYPVFWASVLLTQTVVSLAHLPLLEVTWRDAIINLSMLAGPLHVFWVDNVYWSLVVELAFYIIMLGFFLAHRLRQIEQLVIPWLILQVAATCLSRMLHHEIPEAIALVFLLKYAHLFLAGILCYHIRFSGLTRKRQVLFVCCLVTEFVVQGLWAGLFMLVFCAAFYAMAMKKLGWLVVRPLVFLGSISYSLYLIHANIGYVIMRALASCPRLVQVSVAGAAVLLLATLLTLIVEQPALRIIRKLYKMRGKKPNPSVVFEKYHQ